MCVKRADLQMMWGQKAQITRKLAGIPTWLRSGDSGKEVPSPDCLSSGLPDSSTCIPKAQQGMKSDTWTSIHPPREERGWSRGKQGGGGTMGIEKHEWNLLEIFTTCPSESLNILESWDMIFYECMVAISCSLHTSTEDLLSTLSFQQQLQTFTPGSRQVQTLPY